MVAGPTLSADLSEAEWLDALRQHVQYDGSFVGLGKHHSAVFVERDERVLFVAFETIFGIRAGSDTCMPLAFDVCERRSWSHLTLLAKSQRWYRDQNVYQYFDELVDRGFFDAFDRVIFYGAGMCGYAAGTFSVCAPGANVLLVAPQATLERELTPWDDRFPSSRRFSFRDRYTDASHLCEAAESVLVLFDPDEIEDAMHASLFRSDNVLHFAYRRGSAGAIESDLRQMSLISALAHAAAVGDFKRARVAKVMRVRRRHVPYLRALLSRVMAEERPKLTYWLCRAVLEDHPLPRFRHHLERAEIQLGLRSVHSSTSSSAKRES